MGRQEIDSQIAGSLSILWRLKFDVLRTASYINTNESIVRGRKRRYRESNNFRRN